MIPRVFRVAGLTAVGVSLVVAGYAAAIVPRLSVGAAPNSTLCANATDPITLDPTAEPGMDWLHMPIPAWDFPRGEDGMPAWIQDDRAYWHPMNTATLGIMALNDGDRKLAERTADSIMDHEINGLLPYDFDFTFRVVHKATWHSGLAQGMALALMSRLERQEAEVFLATLRPGSGVAHTDGLDYWIDEYPASNDPVLNGHIWALYGLWDYWLWTGSQEAHDLLVQGIETVRRNLGRFQDAAGQTWYDFDQTGQINPWYRVMYVQQITDLGQLTGESCFYDAAIAFNDPLD